MVVIISFEINYWREVGDETVWNELLPDVVEIVELVEEFVNASSPSPPPGSKPLHSTSLPNGGNQVIFNLDFCLSVPLYFVVGKCRDHRIRMKAIKHLRSSERQEGVSNGFRAALVAERLVEIEEEGLIDQSGRSGDAGEGGMERRVSGVEIRFPGDEEGRREIRAWIRYRVPGAGDGARMVEEWIEW